MTGARVPIGALSVSFARALFMEIGVDVRLGDECERRVGTGGDNLGG